jgi:hypothetical protein
MKGTHLYLRDPVSEIVDRQSYERPNSVPPSATQTHLGSYALFRARVPDLIRGSKDRASNLLDGWVEEMGLEVSSFNAGTSEFGNSGFAYMSSALDVSSRQKNTRQALFKPKRNRDFYSKPSSELSDVPSKEDYMELIRTSPTTGLSYVARMDMDVHYPPDESEMEGMVVLQPRPGDSKSSVDNGSKKKDVSDLCGRAEGYFIEERLSLSPIQAEGRTIGWQESKGENSVLTTVETVLNGVRLPIGTLLTMETDDDGKNSFTYGRLSFFAVEGPYEALIESPRISDSAERNYQDFMEFISASMGREAGNPPPRNIEEVRARLSDIRSLLDDDLALRKCLNQLGRDTVRMRQDQELFDDNVCKEKRTLLERSSKLEPDSAEKKEIEVAIERINIRRSSNLNPAISFRSSLRNMTRMFGAKKVRKTLSLVGELESLGRAMRVAESMGSN